VITKLGFHISAEGGRVAVNRSAAPRFGKKKTVVWRVGFLAEDKSSILSAAGKVVDCFAPGDRLVSMV
jgi:hypothetical protein